MPSEIPPHSYSSLPLSTFTCKSTEIASLIYALNRILASSPQIAKAASLSQSVGSELQKCPSDIYVVVTQPSVSATDYSGQHSSPHLKRWVSGEDKRIRSSFTVANVLGDMDKVGFTEILETKCGAGTLNVDASSEYCWGMKSVRERDISLHPLSSRLLHVKTTKCFIAGLFDIIDDMRPRIINLDFPALSMGPSRLQDMYQNG